MTSVRFIAPLLALALAGCGSAGPYGHARTYVPSDAEQKAALDAKPLDLIMAERRPEAWASHPVSLYAVVSKVHPETGGATVMDVTLRGLQKRNLCREEAEKSCRVTVSERAFGSVRVSVTLRADEKTGPNRVDVGSLLRVIGNLKVPVEGSEEKPMVVGSFHRHWPADEYVTTAVRKYMRR